YSNRAVSSSSREKPSWLRSWSMTRSPFLWTFSPTQHVRKTGFSSLLFPAADGPRGAPRGPSSPPTSHALYRYPYAFSQFRDCPVTIDSHCFDQIAHRVFPALPPSPQRATFRARLPRLGVSPLLGPAG